MPKWNRSSHCGTDHVTEQCVEVAFLEGGEVLLRSSTNPLSTITVTAAEWDAFEAGVAAGDFHRP